MVWRSRSQEAATLRLARMGILVNHPGRYRPRNYIPYWGLRHVTFPQGTRVTRRALALAKAAGRLGEVVVAPKATGANVLLEADPQPLALVALRIDGRRHFKTAALDSITRLRNLRTLDLCSTSINDQTGHGIFGLRHLRDLALSRTQIGPAGVAAICRMANLRGLDIARDPNMTDALARRLLTLPRLTSLVISHCPISSRAFYNTPAQPRLMSLSIARTRCDDVCMKSIVRDRKLVYLNVDGTRVGDRGLHWLRNTGLEMVSAIHSRVTAAGAAKLYWQNNKSLLNVFITNASVHKGLAVFWNSGDITTWVKPAPTPGPGPPKGVIIRNVTVP